MRQPQLLAAAAAMSLAATPALGGVVDVKDTLKERGLTPADFEFLVRRAAPQAPDGYAPAEVDCPSTRPSIRDSSEDVLSPEEREWLPKRRNETVSHIKDFLKRNSINDFDSENYLADATANSSSLPNIGLAFSGGGYRAMLNGAGGVKAFDSRSTGSTDQGNMGGLLQSATYISGLSGGGWLVGSIYTNNFTTVHDAVETKKLWQFGESILEGPEDVGIIDYYITILGQVDDKGEAGFNKSITDYWGRMLSYQLVAAEDGGPAYTFSSIADDDQFSSAKAPLPILVADSRAPDEMDTTLKSLLFEFNPWELGSTDTGMNGFVPLKYTGSKFNEGEMPDDAKCIAGFDNVGYVMGTSSSLFNQILLYIKDDDENRYVPEDIPKKAVEAVIEVLEELSESQNDIADWYPNPFKNWNDGNSYASEGDHLTLVDGGEDGQNIPYHPHTIVEREVDVVFSFDTSADVNNWPNGTAIVATYERSLMNVSDVTSFPAVPGQNTFVNLGLNTRPTFFGCDAGNTTKPAPLVVYLPNYPYVFNSNISTFQMSINDTERNAMIDNGWAVVTQLNSTRDPDWPACVSCAMLSRSFDRTETTVPQQCQDCFSKYCWDGTIDESELQTAYAPSPWSNSTINVTDTDESGAASLGRSQGLATMAIALGLYFLL